MQGMPLASHWSLTGLAVSAVAATSIRWMPPLTDQVAARSAARLEFDWLSRSRISTG